MSFRSRTAFFHQPSTLNPQPIFASVVKLQHSASNGESAGESPAGCTNSNGHVVKPEQQRVQTQNLAALGVQFPSCPPFHGAWPQREQQTGSAQTRTALGVQV